jgi:hypothetical protein
MAEDSKLVKFDMGGAFVKLQGEFNTAVSGIYVMLYV